MSIETEPTDRAEVQQPHPLRRKFTADEDMRLKALVGRYGRNLWDEIAKLMEDRTPRQCRDRYNNYLLESISVMPWTPEEDAIIAERFRIVGPKWADIAKFLRGRNGNHVKNRWNKHICKCDFAQSPQWTNCTKRMPVPCHEPGPVQFCPLLDIDWGRMFDRIEAAMGSAAMDI
jgi:hypothetical protein